MLHLKYSESEKDEYETKIYNICKQSEFFDKNEYMKLHGNLQEWYLTFRFDTPDKFKIFKSAHS